MIPISIFIDLQVN